MRYHILPRMMSNILHICETLSPSVSTLAVVVSAAVSALAHAVAHAATQTDANVPNVQQSCALALLLMYCISTAQHRAKRRGAVACECVCVCVHSELVRAPAVVVCHALTIVSVIAHAPPDDASVLPLRPFSIVCRATGGHAARRAVVLY